MTQKNIDFSNNNTSIYHIRAERTLVLAVVVRQQEYCQQRCSCSKYLRFTTGDVMSTNFVTPDVAEAAKYAFNCQDTNII